MVKSISSSLSARMTVKNLPPMSVRRAAAAVKSARLADSPLRSILADGSAEGFPLPGRL
jgi:hypothetical protein